MVTAIVSIVVPSPGLSSDAYCDVPPRALRLHSFARKKALKKDVDRSMIIPQSQYKKDFDGNAQKLPTFEARQSVHVSKSPCVVFGSEADKSADGSYYKLVPKVPGTYNIVTER